MEVITKNAEETFKLGQEIGSSLNKSHIFALSGELGAGKTTFIQGFAKGLGIDQKIISPTFILMRKYNAKEKSLYHLDLYRLEGDVEKEARNLGLFDIWEDTGNVVLIEWAEKLKTKWPEDVTKIKFESLGEYKRRITIK